ncbi:MAG: molybdopterin-dependent oxidoreductase [Chloroflexota bacterium]
MSENNILMKTLTDTVLTRRSFLKWSAALGGTAALAGGLNYGLKAAEKAATDEGKWISVACWHNCGGRCPNYALVKDGVVIRQKMDDTHPDSPDYPQQRGCARGRAQRHQVFDPDRLKYPMKRKNWAPGGGNKELRGRDEWVRITWDEAFDIVASELQRIKDTYGNKAILSTGGSESERMLSLFGGFVDHWGTTSYGTWRATGPAIGLTSSSGINDRMEHRKVDLFVHFGWNPIWSSGGNPTYNYLQNTGNRKGNAKVIIIDPFYNDTAMVVADEWIPIRPATDIAMALGMLYTLITEDNPVTNPLIDWDFLRRCTVGFDETMMPEGADPKGNLKDYVLGTYDGVPKTPEWASEICGVPPERIKQLAVEIATTKNVAILSANAPARVRNNDHWPQAFMTLGAVTGHIGKSGSMTSGGYYHRYSSGHGPSLVSSGGSGVPGIDNPLEDWSINDNEMWEAVLSGKYTAGYNDIRDINIQCIYHGGSAVLCTRDGQTKGIQAHRKVEFVVSQSQILTTNSKYADVVLPVTTEWERWGTVLTGNREMLIWASQVTEPLFEAKDDYEVAAGIGERLGLDPNEIYPIPRKQMVFNQIAGARIMKDDTPNSGGEYETLVTVTEQDIAALGVEGTPQTGKIPIVEFKERGIVQVPRTPGDNYEYIAFKGFREDPEANPLRTATGKLEIYSQALADRIKNFGWNEIAPIPTYIPPDEGYESTFADWENKIKGEYPLQLYTAHYARRSHSVFDNVRMLRRIFPNEFLMNPIDAEARGIKHGDIVLITSRHGKTLRPVCVTPRIMPGVVNLFHGTWVEMDEDSQIDKAGADNIINGAVASNQGVSGWNSCNVQVEKYTGPIELKPDYKWPRRIPL